MTVDKYSPPLSSFKKSRQMRNCELLDTLWQFIPFPTETLLAQKNKKVDFKFKTFTKWPHMRLDTFPWAVKKWGWPLDIKVIEMVSTVSVLMAIQIDLMSLVNWYLIRLVIFENANIFVKPSEKHYPIRKNKNVLEIRMKEMSNISWTKEYNLLPNANKEDGIASIFWKLEAKFLSISIL